MKKLDDMHPLSVTLFFLCVTLIPMFIPYPVITAVSFIGAAVYVTAQEGRASVKTHLWVGLLFLILTLVNPLISHKGTTILFMINDSPVTLEAFLYGLNSAAGLSSVVYWFAAFARIMDSEKLLCVFSVISARAALVMSCALRYIPLIRAQYIKTRTAQRSLGLYSDGNIVDKIRGDMRVFSVVITWALENGIVTADSMAARGCGSTKRTAFTTQRAAEFDIAAAVCAAALTGICAAASLCDRLDISFYPNIVMSHSSALGDIALAAYFIMAAAPTILSLGVDIRWRYLRSRA